jgi:hypothetical protein
VAEPPPQPLDRASCAALDERLHAAYRATLYRFDAPGGELQLQVDCSSLALQRLLQHARQPCAAVLTAFNPGSVLQEESRNLRAQSALAEELQCVGLNCIPGRHEDPDGRWPTESGLLVLGLGRSAAREMAARYGQLAFLWSDASATPRLVETTSGADLPPRL